MDEKGQVLTEDKVMSFSWLLREAGSGDVRGRSLGLWEVELRERSPSHNPCSGEGS